MARPRATKQGGATPPSGGAEAVVQRTLNQLAPGLAERDTRRLRLDKSYSVWVGQPWAPVANPVARQQNQNSWQSRLRVKWAMSIVDQALANIVQGVPKAKVTPRLPGYEVQAVAMEKLLAYYADLDHLAEKEYPVAQQGLVYGLSPCKTHWRYTEAVQTGWVDMADNDGQTITVPKQTLAVTDDRPTMEPWDAYSIFWDPTAGTVEGCAYIVLESWKTRDELEQGRFNEADGTGQWRNLDRLYQTGDGGKPYQSSQNQILQAPPTGAWIGKFRIWEVWRKTAEGMRLTVIGNRAVLLRDGPSPYWMNSYPVTISNSRPDLFKIEGIAETEMIDHLQQWLWTVQNLRAENWKFTVMRPATVRQTVPDMGAVIMRPGGIIPVTDHDDVRMIEFPPLPAEAYHEEESAIQMMQLVTGINQYVTGAPGGATSNDTATGASLYTQNASRLLQLKASVIHNLTWQRTFEQWGMLCKQFVRRPVQVRIVGEGGVVEWDSVGPAEVNADYDIRIQAGDESITKQADIANATAFLNALVPLAPLNIVNFPALVKQLAEAFGFENAEELVMSAQQPPQAAPFTNGQHLPQGPQPMLLGGSNGGAMGVPHLAPHPLGSLQAGNQ